MKYDLALKTWGRNRLKMYLKKNEYINIDDVKVEMDFREGWSCCGGTDPDCYCSLAESPSMDVRITAVTNKNRTISEAISHYEFDFVTILGEIVDAADGTVTS